MEPLFEYRWQFWDFYRDRPEETHFWMTDWEAERWHAFGKDGTTRIEESRRDRNLIVGLAGHGAQNKHSGPEKDHELPEFSSPTVASMREWWVTPERVKPSDVQRLVLEVISLRRLLRASVEDARQARVAAGERYVVAPDSPGVSRKPRGR